MDLSTQYAFFLASDESPEQARSRDVVLDIFALVHTYAQTHAQGKSPQAYRDAAQQALLRVGGLAASAGGRSAKPYRSFAEGLEALLAFSPDARPREQVAFLKTLGIFDKSKPPTIPPDSTQVTSETTESANLPGQAALRSTSSKNTTRAGDDASLKQDNSAVDMVLYSASVRGANAGIPALSQIWIAFVRWTPPADKDRHPKSRPTQLFGTLDWHVMTAAVNNGWYEAHSAQWEKTTANVNHQRIRQSGRLLVLESTLHMG